MKSIFEVQHLPDNNERESTQAYTPPEMAQKLFNIQQSLVVEYSHTQLSHELKSAVSILLPQFIATALKFSPKLYQEELLAIENLNQLANRRMRHGEWNLIPLFISYQKHKLGLTVHWAEKDTIIQVDYCPETREHSIELVDILDADKNVTQGLVNVKKEPK